MTSSILAINGNGLDDDWENKFSLELSWEAQNLLGNISRFFKSMDLSPYN
jgi:hypothetical protein